MPPASKRYTPGPIRLAGASTTLHPAQKPTGIMTIQQPTIQTIQPTALSPRLTAVMVLLALFSLSFLFLSGSPASDLDAEYSCFSSTGSTSREYGADDSSSDHNRPEDDHELFRLSAGHYPAASGDTVWYSHQRTAGRTRSKDSSSRVEFHRAAVIWHCQNVSTHRPRASR